MPHDRGDAPTPTSPPGPAFEPMRPWRVWVVYGVVGVIVAGHLHEIVMQQEHWPFTNYDMWARVTRDWSLREVVPVGVADAGAAEEVDLGDPAYFAPMPMHYQRINFRRAAGREKKLRDRMLADYLWHYERRRAAGLHGGPPLRGIRLYEWRWKMDTEARNARRPDEVVLLYEFAAAAAPDTAPATAPATPPATAPAGAGQ